jgi:tetratricopeptide (TPR) repeat protein
MKTLSFLLFTLLILGPSPGTASAPGRHRAPAAELTAAASLDRAAAELEDAKDDPGYAMYKEGYNLVLEERWDEARKRFATMIKQFAKSDYIDDAHYWAAYAMKHIDRKKAGEEYRQFIKDYPKSNYFDDAVADLNQLDSEPFVVSIGEAPSAVTVTGTGTSSSSSYGYGFGRNTGRAVAALERSLRKLNRLDALPAPASPRSPRAAIAGRIPGPTPLPGRFEYSWSGDEEEKLDPETQLKIEALYALGNSKEDEKSFATLKQVALDTKAALPLRRSALDALSDFKKFDVLPVYLEIARRDTAEEMQNLAIDFISSHGKDKNKSVTTLIDLFNTLPKARSEQRRTVFYFIADVGNDRAVDFLGSVAKTSDDYDLRREAIVYLGSIGSEKARSVLYGILGGEH